jgi:hypothetical protein
MRETSRIDIPWLERQTGVQYQTLKKHYARWWPDDGGRELLKFADDYPELFAKRKIVPTRRRSRGQSAQVPEITNLSKCERGDLNPHG